MILFNCVPWDIIIICITTTLEGVSILDQVVYPSLFSMSLMLEWVGDDDDTGGSYAGRVPPTSPRGVNFPRLCPGGRDPASCRRGRGNDLSLEEILQLDGLDRVLLLPNQHVQILLEPVPHQLLKKVSTGLPNNSFETIINFGVFGPAKQPY